MPLSLPGVAIYLAAFSLASGALVASMTLHRDVLNNCLRSPMLFFDTTPIGRIMNRFSKDVDLVDTMIPRNWEMCVKCTFSVLATLFVICYNIPSFLVPAIPLAIFYILVQVLSGLAAQLHIACCVYINFYHPLQSSYPFSPFHSLFLPSRCHIYSPLTIPHNILTIYLTFS